MAAISSISMTNYCSHVPSILMPTKSSSSSSGSVSQHRIPRINGQTEFRMKLDEFFSRHPSNRKNRFSAGPVRVVSEKVVGIDLETINSVVTAIERGKPTMITNSEGHQTTPSVVAYTKNGDRLVRQIVKRQAIVNPENIFFSVKLFISRKMNEVDEVSLLSSC